MIKVELGLQTGLSSGLKLIRWNLMGVKKNVKHKYRMGGICFGSSIYGRDLGVLVKHN